MKIVVTGGRDFGQLPKQSALIHETLDRLHRERVIETLVHGDCRGADRVADEWAAKNAIVTKRWPANWTLFRNMAGPIRNDRMLRAEMPDLVVAFPGGSGTADCVAKARALALNVLIVKGGGLMKAWKKQVWFDLALFALVLFCMTYGSDGLKNVAVFAMLAVSPLIFVAAFGVLAGCEIKDPPPSGYFISYGATLSVAVAYFGYILIPLLFFIACAFMELAFMGRRSDG